MILQTAPSRLYLLSDHCRIPEAEHLAIYPFSAHSSIQSLLSSIPVVCQEVVYIGLGGIDDGSFPALPSPLPLEQALALEVARIASCVQKVQERCPWVAVWYPVDLLANHELDACLCGLLRTRLAECQIPVLTNEDELRKFRQGLDGRVAIRERRIEQYASIERVVHKQWPGLQLTFIGAPQYVTVAFIAKELLAKVHTITIGSTIDGETFTYTSHTIFTADGTDVYQCKIPVMAQAKSLIISAVMGFVEESDIDIFLQSEVTELPTLAD